MFITTFPFSISRVIYHPLESVFTVFTKPNHLAQWMVPDKCNLIRSSQELKVGGFFHYGFEYESGEQVWGKQVYKEITKNERLIFIQSFSDPTYDTKRHPGVPNWPLEMLSITTFMRVDEKTTIVTITCEPWNTDHEGLLAFDSAKENMRFGFDNMLKNIDIYMKSIFFI